MSILITIIFVLIHFTTMIIFNDFAIFFPGIAFPEGIDLPITAVIIRDTSITDIRAIYFQFQAMEAERSNRISWVLKMFLGTFFRIQKARYVKDLSSNIYSISLRRMTLCLN
jgi:hypothetical protein